VLIQPFKDEPRLHYLKTQFVSRSKHFPSLLDFKLSRCTEFCMLSFGWLPGVWNLYADVSEHSVPSS